MTRTPAGSRQPWTIALVVWVVLTGFAGVAAASRVFVLDRAHANLVLALVVTGFCAVCAVAAWLLGRRGGVVARSVGWVCAYHAMLAPIALIELACYLTSRNDMPSMWLYPHVVAFLNSFE